MATVPAIASSVIVVSRHRPDALLRAIAGIRQLDHPCVELIVVADPAACALVRGLGIPVKLLPFDEANIAAARNLGLALAAGDVVAFLDDDAVPEPTWLSRLVAPFADPQVAASGGFVRGRNGISFQWRAREVDAVGQDHTLRVDPAAVSLLPGKPGRAVKTQGTNCAFRTQALRGIGGFDPAFRFYLDEADVNMRLAALGGLTAIVPLAQVHHGYAQSRQRRADRVPLSLHDIGASTVVFLRRHAHEGDWPGALTTLRADQRARALRHMVTGGLEPRDVARLLATLEQGMAEGRMRPLPACPPVTAAAPPFMPLPGTGPRNGLIIAGRVWQRKALLAQAQRAVAQGHIVTVICLAPTARAHRHSFTASGVWLQQGGLFGRADRREPLLRLTTFAARVARECRRLSPLRPLSRLPHL